MEKELRGASAQALARAQTALVAELIDRLLSTGLLLRTDVTAIHNAAAKRLSGSAIVEDKEAAIIIKRLLSRFERGR
jgi:hypothetical protein